MTMTDSLRDFLPDVFTCDICRETFDMEYHELHVHEDEPICEDCLKEHFIVCDYCGEVIDKDDEFEVCPECGSELKKENA